jgi:aminotransferase in exopolysaccharide biosynthesis
MSIDVDHFVGFARSLYGDGFIPLHRPVFAGNEKRYLAECVDSNFVSSVGVMVAPFEAQVEEFTGSHHAVACVNGTAALHVALQVAGVERGDEVLSQALTFIATCNALSYVGAVPVFIDVDEDTMGMSPEALGAWLSRNVEMRGGRPHNRGSGRRIAACVPMHTFGFVCRIEEIARICRDYGIVLVEDAAESLGSRVGTRHSGTFGAMATLSFNGNKVVTTGGGGMVVTDDEALAKRLKHLTTTAKIPHPYEFVHDEVGYNYRLPNINAALGCAQLEQLAGMLQAKAEVAERYRNFFAGSGTRFVEARAGTTANHWLNAIVLDSLSERDAFLVDTNARGVMTRPIWRLMSSLPMFADCQNDGLEVSRWLEERVVNLPSSVPDATVHASAAG